MNLIFIYEKLFINIMNRWETEKEKQYQKAWRQSHAGKRRRNISHWRSYGVREPEEGWVEFYDNTFCNATNCALCNVEFGENGNSSNGKCLDHHHASGYIRNIICRKCNISTMPLYDLKFPAVLLEIHRRYWSQ